MDKNGIGVRVFIAPSRRDTRESGGASVVKLVEP
jgi:hypothetical protein